VLSQYVLSFLGISAIQSSVDDISRLRFSLGRWLKPFASLRGGQLMSSWRRQLHVVVKPEEACEVIAKQEEAASSCATQQVITP
jgi:hypothetical protein